MKKYLVTSALPYANGPLHVGHLAGAYIPADVYVRYLKSKREDVLFICGSDEHGVPITLEAEKRGIKPKEFVDEIHNQMDQTFKNCGIDFDNFSGTSREDHYDLASEFFVALKENGYLSENKIEQLHCENCDRFLPDRYVEGQCPKCKKDGARGDQCESCGSDLDQMELIEPSCKICGSTPNAKETSHWFLKLGDFEEKLKEWQVEKKGIWKDNVLSFCSNLIKDGLPSRAITRDMKWGVPVPGAVDIEKVLYVWFDAPIGYISSTIEWAKAKGDESLWKKYWKEPDTSLVHFIGKDNIVFHSVMWPAMLMGVNQNYILPDQIPANEFMNLEGDKISTSRNWAVWAHEFVELFPADTLRYYLASIAPESKDSDFSWSGFGHTVNSELADILGNFINRTITFVNKYFDGKVPELGDLSEEDKAMISKIEEQSNLLSELYSKFSVRKACFEFMNLAREGNKYFDSAAPWKSRKDNMEKCATSLHVSLKVIKALSVISMPIIPFTAQKIASIFNKDILENKKYNPEWKIAIEELSVNKEIVNPGILFTKIEEEVLAEQKAKLGTKKS